jgi:hypothetical protein
MVTKVNEPPERLCPEAKVGQPIEPQDACQLIPPSDEQRMPPTLRK